MAPAPWDKGLACTGQWAAGMMCDVTSHAMHDRALPVLPQAVQAAAHEVVHGVVGGRHAAEYLAHTLRLLFLSNVLEAWWHAGVVLGGDTLCKLRAHSAHSKDSDAPKLTVPPASWSVDRSGDAGSIAGTAVLTLLANARRHFSVTGLLCIKAMP